MSGTLSFYQALTAAVGDMVDHGFDTVERLAYWVQIIRDAAERSLTPEWVVEQQLDKFFGATYRRLIDKGQVLKKMPGVTLFDLNAVKPKLHAELQRRRVAAHDLVKLNREKMLQDLEQRFTGWATSIPEGGIKGAEKNEIKAGIKKSMQSLPFTERRVHIDQAHKFIASLSDIVATDSGAIAAIWHSHWRQRNYNYRHDHKERDEQIYLIRGSWAIERGLIRTTNHLYTDEIEMPGEFVYCRCFYQYLFHLNDLPPGLLSAKGEQELRAAKLALAL